MTGELVSVIKVDRWWVEFTMEGHPWKALIERENEEYLLRDCWPTSKASSTKELRNNAASFSVKVLKEYWENSDKVE